MLLSNNSTSAIVGNTLHGSDGLLLCSVLLQKKHLCHWLVVNNLLMFCFPQQLFREVRIMKILNHPNIGKIIYLLCTLLLALIDVQCLVYVFASFTLSHIL